MKKNKIKIDACIHFPAFLATFRNLDGFTQLTVLYNFQHHRVLTNKGIWLILLSTP